MQLTQSLPVPDAAEAATPVVATMSAVTRSSFILRCRFSMSHLLSRGGSERTPAPVRTSSSVAGAQGEAQVSKSTFLEVAYRRLLLFTELPRRGIFSETQRSPGPRGVEAGWKRSPVSQSCALCPV